MTEPKDESLMRMADVQRRCGGLSRQTIYRWMDLGVFPRPLQINLDPETGESVGIRKRGQIVVWLKSDIDEWVANVISTQLGPKRGPGRPRKKPLQIQNPPISSE